MSDTHAGQPVGQAAGPIVPRPEGKLLTLVLPAEFVRIVAGIHLQNRSGVHPLACCHLDLLAIFYLVIL
jgi:hypothetical protein